MSRPRPQQLKRRGGVLRIAHIGERPTLDRHWTTAAITGQSMYNVNGALFAVHSRFEVKPVLVDTWKTSSDRLTYTFALRKGVKFHNGKELTSEDVKASLERVGVQRGSSSCGLGDPGGAAHQTRAVGCL